MKKKCQVVMLPTEKASKITKEYLNDKDNLFYFPEPIIGKSGKNQHLYFITDEEIKEGDWCLLMTPKIKLFKCAQVKTEPQLIIKSNIREVHYPNQCKKIIATTDESLEVVSKGINPVYEKLPRPSNEFLKAYCEAYNSNPITEVNIEYVKLPIWRSRCPNGTMITEIVGHTNTIKIAPDNTITISKVEEKVYTREEVIELCEKAFKTQYGTGIYSFDNWIKQNLK